jgi:CDP-paratose 2-epimerase
LILISGGFGFLGSNLAAALLERKKSIVIVDNFSRLGSQKNFSWLKTKGEFTHFNTDIRDFSSIVQIVKTYKPDFIVHLAGQVAMTASIADPRLDHEINTLGTLNILEAIRLYSPSTAIIYSSTNKVYGELSSIPLIELPLRYLPDQTDLGFKEDLTLEFQSPYGCSKGAAEQYILDYGNTYGVAGIVLRHSSMYGERQFSTTDQGWIGWFCYQAILLKRRRLSEIVIAGNGKQVRDALHSKDMVALYIDLLENFDRAKGRAYNIGGGINNALSLLELFEILSKILQIEIPLKHNPARIADQKYFVADISAISRTVGWSPRVNVKNGLLSMLEWTESIYKE